VQVEKPLAHVDRARTAAVLAQPESREHDDDDRERGQNVDDHLE
jgi:hypothetical protein